MILLNVHRTTLGFVAKGVLVLGCLLSFPCGKINAQREDLNNNCKLVVRNYSKEISNIDELPANINNIVKNILNSYLNI